MSCENFDNYNSDNILVTGNIFYDERWQRTDDSH